MKLHFLTRMLTALAIALSATATISQPGTAQSRTTFFCASSNGVPTTFARTPRGNIPMISWRTATQGWTPQRRCQEVTSRFQRHQDNGTLRFLKADYRNGAGVICATASASESCNASNVLFTVTQGDPNSTLQKLLDGRGLASGITVNESAEVVNVEDYMNKYLSEVPGSVKDVSEAPEEQRPSGATKPASAAGNVPWFAK